VNTRSLVTLALLGGGLFAAGAALQQPKQPQPTIIPIQPTQPLRIVKTTQYAAWIPPGTYSAIVLNSSGDERRWAVSLMVRDTSVPVVVPPADNIVIPFKDGWTVEAKDEARLVSSLVPFDDSSKYNKFGEGPDYVLSAWGITNNGPVQFVYREIK
jgi:hypothetical protein